jgi:hypothetical protein
MKRIFSLFIFVLAILQTSLAQNLFDAERTNQFAVYLTQSGQYRLAAIEFERLVFLQPSVDSMKFNLLNCYLQDKNYDAVFRRSIQLKEQSPNNDIALHSYASFALIADHKHQEASQFINQASLLDAQRKAYYNSWNLILQNKFKEASQVAAPFKSNPAFAGILEIENEVVKLPRKSPFLAAMLSTAIPGAGKWYAKERKDAIVGFITVGMMAYQAYRGFRKDGQKSVYGWISAGLGAGFYLGNIYGSAKSAKRFNNRQYAKLRPSIERNFTIYR